MKGGCLTLRPTLSSTGDIRLLTLKITNQFIQSCLVLDVVGLNSPQQSDRLLNCTEPKQRQELVQHLIANIPTL